MTLRRATLAEPLSVVLHALRRIPIDVAGRDVLVCGAGPIGLLLVTCLVRAGARSVVVTDLFDRPLAIARELGATNVVNLADGGKVASDSFDIAVEATGAPASLTTVIRALREHGVMLQLGMLRNEDLNVNLAGIVTKELTVLGSFRFGNELDEAIEILLELPGLERIISDVVDLEDVERAFHVAADSKESSKVMVAVQSDGLTGLSGAVGKVAWIIGGGSGIGQGAAEALAGIGATVVVSGRREAELSAAADELSAAGLSASAIPVDVSDPASVLAAHSEVVERFGPVGILVYSAGTNVVNRYWKDGDAEDFARINNVNLTGAVRAIHAVLPDMRERADGLVIVVSSWAGWRFVPAVGAAYAATKTALGALVETLNHQEGSAGIRATHLCPADVKTDILLRRPVVPTEEQQALMMTRHDLGETVRWIASLPASVCVNELVISPTINANYGHLDTR